MALEMMALSATSDPRLIRPKMTTTMDTNSTDHCGTSSRGCTAPRYLDSWAMPLSRPKVMSRRDATVHAPWHAKNMASRLNMTRHVVWRQRRRQVALTPASEPVAWR